MEFSGNIQRKVATVLRDLPIIADSTTGQKYVPRGAGDIATFIDKDATPLYLTIATNAFFRRMLEMPVDGRGDYTPLNALGAPQELGITADPERNVENEGTQVAALQMMLYQLNIKNGQKIPPLDVTGGYDENLEKLVRDFQVAQGLNVTGELDLETRDALNRAYHEHLRDNMVALQEHHQDTVGLQYALRGLGYNGVPFNGVIDERTTAAIRVAFPNFQGDITPGRVPELLREAREQLGQKLDEYIGKTNPTPANIEEAQRALAGLGYYHGAFSQQRNTDFDEALRAYESGEPPPFDPKSMPSAAGLYVRDRNKYTPDIDMIARTGVISGNGSWYGGYGYAHGVDDGRQGGRTASGIPFYRELPIVALPKGYRHLYGTIVQVKAKGEDGVWRTAYALAADTGSFHLAKYGGGRVIDMSESLARDLHFHTKGVTEVSWEVDIDRTIQWRDYNGLPMQNADRWRSAREADVRDGELTPVISPVAVEMHAGTPERAG